MENVDQFLSQLKDMIWSIPLLILLIGTGTYLTIILRGVQFRYLGYAIKQVLLSRVKILKGYKPL